MKVLHIINNLKYGGAEKMLLDIIKLQEESLEVDLLVLGKKEMTFDLTSILKRSRIFYSNQHWSLRNPLHIIHIYRFIKNYDIIHVHLFPAQYWTAAAVLMRRGRYKVITTEHSTKNGRMNKLLFYPIERIAYSIFDRIVCISKETKEHLANWLRISNKKFQIIHNGISIEDYQNAKGYNKIQISPTLHEDDILLIIVARLSEAKDHLTVLKALKLLPHFCKLLIVGNGILKNDYQEYCKNNHISERVLFLGGRQDVPRLLKSSDISILSSHWEGFGLTAIESMAAGIPLIASDVPGLREVVLDAGILFRKGNADELAKNILMLIKDKALKDSIISAQIARAKIYDIKKTVLEYNSLYEEVLARKVN